MNHINFIRIASCRRIVQDAAAGVSRKPQFTRAALLPTAMDAPTVPSISSQLFSHPPTSWENSSFSQHLQTFNAFPLQSRLMRRIEQLYKIMCEYLAPNTQNKSNPSFFYLFHSMFFRFGFFGVLADPLHQRRDLRLGLRVVKRHPPGGARGSLLSKVGGQT